MGASSWTPAKVAGLALWLRADDLAGADGDAISSWVSREGKAYNFAQTLTKRPLLKKGANGINGHNTVLFDGSNDILVYAGADISTASLGTCFAVYRLTAIPAGKTFEVFGSANASAGTSYWLCRGILATATPNISIVQINADTEDKLRGGTNLTTATPYLGVWKSTGAATSLRVNGAAETITVVSGANNGDWLGDTANRENFTLGGIKVGSETNFLNGDLAELLLYDTNLSASDLATVEKYLANIYGITLP